MNMPGCVLCRFTTSHLGAGRAGRGLNANSLTTSRVDLTFMPEFAYVTIAQRADGSKTTGRNASSKSRTGGLLVIAATGVPKNDALLSKGRAV